MVDGRTEFNLEELAERAGVPVRTVRFYIAEGLLTGPRGRGTAATYSEGHLARLRLIRLLVEQRVPLAEIRERLAGLTEAEVHSILAGTEDQTRSLRRALAEPSPRAYISALLEQARAPQRAPVLSAPAARAAVPAASLHVRAKAPVESNAWLRIPLAAGLELHVRADQEALHRELIERIRSLAKDA